MAAPFVGAGARAKAARLGFHVDVITIKSVRGWPTKSTRPVHLRRIADDKHVAAFADAMGMLRYLAKQEAK